MSDISIRDFEPFAAEHWDDPYPLYDVLRATGHHGNNEESDDGDPTESDAGEAATGDTASEPGERPAEGPAGAATRQLSIDF